MIPGNAGSHKRRSKTYFTGAGGLSYSEPVQSVGLEYPLVFFSKKTPTQTPPQANSEGSALFAEIIAFGKQEPKASAENLRTAGTAAIMAEC